MHRSIPHHCSTARNDFLLHSVALHIMVCHAMVSFAVLCPFFVMVLLRGWGTINLCGIGHHDGIVAVILALLVVAFLWRLLLCCFLRVEKTINLCGGLSGHCGWLIFWFLHFLLVALRIMMIGSDLFSGLTWPPGSRCMAYFYLLFFLFLVVVVAMAWFLLLQQRGCCLWC